MCCGEGVLMCCGEGVLVVLCIHALIWTAELLAAAAVCNEAFCIISWNCIAWVVY